MNEHELERLARTLGERAAERLDVETTARAVVERLREQPTEPARWVTPEWLRIAAALLIVAGSGLTLQRLSGPPTPLPAAYAIADLNDLTTSELTEMLATLDRTLAGDSPEESEFDLDSLTPAQLETLLRSLET